MIASDTKRPRNAEWNSAAAILDGNGGMMSKVSVGGGRPRTRGFNSVRANIATDGNFLNPVSERLA